MKIKETLKRDLSRRIEEVVKVDQINEDTVYEELTEYVVTDTIRRHYTTLLSAIMDWKDAPNEGIGVWVSGFFGSGKSMFTKILGYILADQKVKGQRASDLFKERVGDPQVSEMLDWINQSLPFEVIMFDIASNENILADDQSVAEIVYKVLLKHLDYAEDYDIAELEIELEAEEKLNAFLEKCLQLYGGEVRQRPGIEDPLPPGVKEELREALALWRMIRLGAQRVDRASRILHEMDSKTYPSVDAWARNLAGRRSGLTVDKCVDRIFELGARRRPGKGLVFIVDEVGQYVARREEKIENLRSFVQALGKEGKNRATSGDVPSPCWFVVTAQERLEEVVAAIDSRRVQLARLQDRFRHTLDLPPQDIRAVATQRVLAKNPTGREELVKVFRKHEGALSAALSFEGSKRRTTLEESEFVESYPYPPHLVDLSIDIATGLRLQGHAPRQFGGGNRTLIKQAFEMLVNPQTAYAEKEIGALVTVDRIYVLVEGLLRGDRRMLITDIERSLGHDSIHARIAKALLLLEYVSDLPRTERNLSACLVDNVGATLQVEAVRDALEEMRGSYVRLGDEGWKLLTPTEQNWVTDRQALAPPTKERRRILREGLTATLDAPRRRTYRYENAKTFQAEFAHRGDQFLGEGQLPVDLFDAESPDTFSGVKEDVRKDSRSSANQNKAFLAFALNTRIDDLVTEVYRSEEMIRRHDQRRAQGRLSDEESKFLEHERRDEQTYRRRLGERIEEALASGSVVFRGAAKDCSDLGKNLDDVLQGAYGWIVPDLYAKFHMAAKPIQGREIEAVLTADTLQGMPPVLRNGQEGLGLLAKEGDAWVPNLQGELCREVMGYLRHQQEHQERDSMSGRALKNYFGGLGYGWDEEAIRLVLAVLFRAGTIEVYHQGQRHSSHKDRDAHEPFLKTRAFNTAIFPR